MLTATYTLVAISVEQKKARELLQALENTLDLLHQEGEQVTLSTLVQYAENVQQLEEFLQHRNITRHLVPALRRFDQQAMRQLATLDAMGEQSRELVRLAKAVSRADSPVSHLLEVLRRYCQSAIKRLQFEEQELVPCARRLLSVEEWFRIASQLMLPGNPVEFLNQPNGQSRP